MDLKRILAELRARKAHIEEAIAALERLTLMRGAKDTSAKSASDGAPSTPEIKT